MKTMKTVGTFEELMSNPLLDGCYEYNGVAYGRRAVVDNEGVEMWVAGESLDKAVFINGDFPDWEANKIDSQVCCYVPDEVLLYPYDELRAYLKVHCQEVFGD